MSVAIERRLKTAFSDASPARLREALLAAVTGSAARVRPLLCVTVAASASGREAPELAWAAATAIEMIHCASLAHDDLPCFDDASERRGRPSLHRLYDEPTALLAGDALIVGAFRELARVGAPPGFITQIALATGASGGLVSGQALELDERVDVQAYHAAKTGGLFEAASRLGALAVGVDDEPFALLGRELGALYQIADDLADVFGDAATLGKPTGQDLAHARPTAFDGLSAEEAIALIDARHRRLLEAVPPCVGQDKLRYFIDAVGRRLRQRLHP